MKKIFSLLAVLSLLLSACGGSNSDSNGSTGDTDEPYFYNYNAGTFSIDAPEEWQRQENFTSEYPDELIVAFKNNLRDQSFTANVTVIEEKNSSALTSQDYSQKKLSEHTGTLINYTLLSQETLTLKVNGADSRTTLSTFEGKNENASPTLQFMQVSLSKGEKAWTVTATYRPIEDAFTVKRMKHMLESFTLN